MRKERTMQNVHDKCVIEGSFSPLAVADEELVRTMMQLALTDLETAKGLAQKTPPKSGAWNAIYKMHYDVLHSLIEAFLRLGKIKAATHECVFSYLCMKHQELELDWNFFEKIRSKRNRSVYYGEAIAYQDWKDAELQFNLYIKTMKNVIEEKIKGKF